MNTSSTVVVSALLATAAAVAVSFALRPSGEVAPATATVEQLVGRIDQLQQANAQLQAEVRRMQQGASQPASGAVATERSEGTVVSDEQLQAAVAAWFAQRGGVPAEASAGAGAAEVGFDIERDFDQLAGTSFWSNSALWKRVFEAGRMDEVIAKYEALAKANPQDVDAQMELARACMSYIQMDQSKWEMSQKADSQFDKVLDLDDHHWEARFTKAVSYTFWPDFLGKKKEAISHFETLIEQQDSMPVTDDQAQTYLYLGNLLADRDPERAAKVWQRGLARHPNNGELRQKLGN